MIYFSSLLKSDPTYIPAADNLFAALDLFNIKYKLISNTKDIWVRDFMPVKTGSGRYISFRYEPSYLREYSELRTDFREDISCEQKIANIVYSDINLDGGNVVFSPSRQKAIISDRVFSENPEHYDSVLNLQLLEELTNKSKGDDSLSKWAKEKEKNHNDLLVKESTSLDIKDFDLFIRDRKECIIKRLNKILEI